jgi:hypothetical protein
MNYYVVKSYPGSIMVLSQHYNLDVAIDAVAFKKAGERGDNLFPESEIYVIETEEHLDLTEGKNILYGDIAEVFEGMCRGLEEIARRAGY